MNDHDTEIEGRSADLLASYRQTEALGNERFERVWGRVEASLAEAGDAPIDRAGTGDGPIDRAGVGEAPFDLAGRRVARQRWTPVAVGACAALAAMALLWFGGSQLTGEVRPPDSLSVDDLAADRDGGRNTQRRASARGLGEPPEDVEHNDVDGPDSEPLNVDRPALDRPDVQRPDVERPDIDRARRFRDRASDIVAPNAGRTSGSPTTIEPTRNAATMGTPSAPESTEPKVPDPDVRSPGAETVAEETRLLRAAQLALNGGDGARAWALLTESTARFPTGTLEEERAALRVLTLCDLGHTPQARREAARFLDRFPQSPLTQRVESACDRK